MYIHMCLVDLSKMLRITECPTKRTRDIHINTILMSHIQIFYVHRRTIMQVLFEIF